MRERVVRARQRRAFGRPLPSTVEAEALLLKASRRMALSARGISRCVGVARTIASLGARESVDRDALSEALQFRVPARELGEDGEDTGAAAVASDTPRWAGEAHPRVFPRSV